MNDRPVSPPTKKTPFNEFDPFNDRLSRDIRNTLSEAFINSLSRGEPSDYLVAAEKWLTEKLTAGCIAYIKDRLYRYDHVLEKIIASRLDDALLQSLVLWNNGLFFEFHEHLERIWHRTSGDEYQAFKGMIKAAGVYIHLEHHRQQAAESLSIKSLELIRQYSHCLAFISNLDVLIRGLEMLTPVSPKLENPVLNSG